MPTSAIGAVLMVALAQSGWGLAHAQPRQVGRTYWELIPQMEVWVRLVPEHPEEKPPLVNLVFHAFYPGRAERDPYTGLPQWPTGAPARLTVSAEPLPRTVVRKLGLRLEIDGKTIDLTGPHSKYRKFHCFMSSAYCRIEAELDPAVLQALVTARSAGGSALGFPIRITAADQSALGEFQTRAGLTGDTVPAPRRR